MIAATRELYRVFSAYPHRAIQGCPCCTTREDERALALAPLAELTHADLETFARKALTTMGDADDFRHFLPRILELSLEPSAHLGFHHEVIGGKLVYAGWGAWPEAEQVALRAWVVALFVASVEGRGAWAEGAIALAAAAEMDLAPLLGSVWPPPVAAAKLARAIVAFARTHVPEAVEAWLRDPEKRAYLVSAIEAEHDVPEVLERAAEVLDAPREWARPEDERGSVEPARAPRGEATPAPLAAPRAPLAWLEVEVAGEPPARYPLGAGTDVTIGRGPSAELRVPSLRAGTVNSVLHTSADGTSVLSATGPHLRIEVNGARLEGPRALDDGDVVEHHSLAGGVALRWVYRKGVRAPMG